MRRRWWLFMSRWTLRNKLEAKRLSFHETSQLIKERGDDNAEFYAGAAWGVMTVTETLFYKGLSERQVRKIQKRPIPETDDD